MFHISDQTKYTHFQIAGPPLLSVADDEREFGRASIEPQWL